MLKSKNINYIPYISNSSISTEEIRFVVSYLTQRHAKSIDGAVDAGAILASLAGKGWIKYVGIATALMSAGTDIYNDVSGHKSEVFDNCNGWGFFFFVSEEEILEEYEKFQLFPGLPLYRLGNEKGLIYIEPTQSIYALEVKDFKKLETYLRKLELRKRIQTESKSLIKPSFFDDLEKMASPGKTVIISGPPGSGKTLGCQYWQAFTNYEGETYRYDDLDRNGELSISKMEEIKEKGAFVLITVNNFSSISPAITRPGRADYHIRLEGKQFEQANRELIKGIVGGNFVEEMSRWKAAYANSFMELCQIYSKEKALEEILLRLEEQQLQEENEKKALENKALGMMLNTPKAKESKE